MRSFRAMKRGLFIRLWLITYTFVYIALIVWWFNNSGKYSTMKGDFETSFLGYLLLLQSLFLLTATIRYRWRIMLLSLSLPLIILFFAVIMSFVVGIFFNSMPDQKLLLIYAIVNLYIFFCRYPLLPL